MAILRVADTLMNRAVLKEKRKREENKIAQSLSPCIKTTRCTGTGTIRVQPGGRSLI